MQPVIPPPPFEEVYGLLRTTHYARTLKRWVQCHAARLRGDCGLQVRLILDSGGADGWGRAFVRAHSRELRRLAPGAGPALDELDFTAHKAGRWSQVVKRALAARQGSHVGRHVWQDMCDKISTKTSGYACHESIAL